MLPIHGEIISPTPGNYLHVFVSYGLVINNLLK